MNYTMASRGDTASGLRDGLIAASDADRIE